MTVLLRIRDLKRAAQSHRLTLFLLILVTYTHVQRSTNNLPERSDPAALKSVSSDTTTKMKRPLFVYKQQETGINTHGASYKKYAAHHDRSGHPVTVLEWAQSMAAHADATSDSLTQLLRETPFDAFFLECKPASSVTSSHVQFEFVVVDAPELFAFCDGRSNADAFAEPLAACSTRVCAFPSLGNDAVLIASKQPLPSESNADYSHCARFVRTAHPTVIRQMWKLVAEQYVQALHSQNKPVWLSTSGMGVPWLHFRLDSRPKYYTFDAYKRVAL
jgi:hypothetical protein